MEPKTWSDRARELPPAETVREIREKLRTDMMGERWRMWGSQLRAGPADSADYNDSILIATFEHHQCENSRGSHVAPLYLVQKVFAALPAILDRIDELEQRAEDAERLRVDAAQRAIDGFDRERVLAWMRDTNRKPAETAFTAGPERNAAYLIEDAAKAERAKCIREIWQRYNNLSDRKEQKCMKYAVAILEGKTHDDAAAFAGD